MLQVKPGYGFAHPDCAMKPPVRDLPMDQVSAMSERAWVRACVRVCVCVDACVRAYVCVWGCVRAYVCACVP